MVSSETSLTDVSCKNFYLQCQLCNFMEQIPLDNLLVAQIIKFPAFYGTRIIAVLK